MMRRWIAGAMACALIAVAPAGAAADSLTVTASDAAKPSLIKLTEGIVSGTSVVKSFERDAYLTIGEGEEYGVQNGVLAFRGGPLRQNAAVGQAQITESGLHIVWETKTGTLERTYTGFDWTAQPLIVKWHKEIREMMNLNEEKKAKVGLKEVIYPSMDGKIYFLDLDDGKETREAIQVGYPLKGTGAVDPRGWPILYTGQGISKLSSGTGKIGLRMFNLITGEEMYLENGRNKGAYITNGAVDGSALVLADSDTLVFGGENGLLYTVKLNTSFGFAESYDLTDTTLTISPETLAYRYQSNLKGDQGMEGSVALYGPYAFVGDNLGVLQCVNLNTLSCEWALNVEDNTDATVALERSGADTLALYTANTLKKRTADGDVTMRRVNALTGEIEWERKVACSYNKTDIAGAMASPIIGEETINDLVIFTINRANENGAVMYALDKQTGEEVWTCALGASSWSSPVAMYTSSGDCYIAQAAADGSLRLIEGVSGAVLCKLELGEKIVASPAVYSSEDGTMLVIGTAEGTIFGIDVY